MIELTSTELKSLPKETKVYEGVGKMFVPYFQFPREGSALTLAFRFVYSQTPKIEKRLASETAEIKSDVSNLNKKLHYLETTYEKSREHIDKIFRSGGR